MTSLTNLEEEQLIAALRATKADPDALVTVANHLRMAAQKLDWAEGRLKQLESLAFCLLTSAKAANVLPREEGGP